MIAAFLTAVAIVVMLVINLVVIQFILDLITDQFTHPLETFVLVILLTAIDVGFIYSWSLIQ